MPITLPLFYKKESSISEEQPTSPRRSKILWIAIAILVNVALAASAIVISKRLKREEYIPPEEVPAAVEILCKNPIDVALVIDLSGSMLLEGGYPPQPITDAKNAAKTFIEAIDVTDNPEETDRVTIVSYEDQAHLNLGLSNDVTALNSTIDSLVAIPEGWTNIGGAIEAARIEIASNGRTGASKAIIILSDGVANVDSNTQRCEEWPTTHTTCTQYVIDQAGLASNEGISVYTIGLNLDQVEQLSPGAGVIAEDTLKQAAGSEENYFAAPDSSDLENIYITIAERVCDLGLISGHVFNDWDQDGAWDSEEPPLTGWGLTMVYETSPRANFADGEGAYTFTNLLPGAYALSINALEGWIQTLAPPSNFNLDEGQNIENVDFAFYDPNATHLTCQGEICAPVAGGGLNECATDSDCTSPTHKSCVGDQCLTVSGEGSDTCTTDSDCLYGALQVHKICSDGSCIEVSGEGTDECVSDYDCATITTETHRECRDSLCTTVSGAGVDECVVNSDCISEPQPTGGTSTPSSSPATPTSTESGAPATGWISPTIMITLLSFFLLIIGAVVAI